MNQPLQPIRRCGMSYSDKIVLITGGSRGIGFGIARVFADAGARVAICGRNGADGQEAEALLNDLAPGSSRFWQCDVSRPADVQQFVDDVVSHFGRLDCLINNVATHPKHQPIDNFDVDHLRALFEINVLSFFAATVRALPHLRKTGGSIVNIGSLTSIIGEEGATTYSMTKATMNAFTKSLAIEESRNGVRVNCVLPGNILSDGRIRAQAARPDGDEYGDWLDSHQPIGRSGTNEEVGQLCLFLASEAASYISGTEHIVSHGAELGYGVKYPLPMFAGAMFH